MPLPYGLRHSLRRLAREPGFTAVAVLMLAIGIGASTAMFSVVHAVLLQPFGVDQPDRVVVIWPEHRGIVGEFPFSSRRNLLGRVAAFDQVAVFGSVNWSDTVRLPNAEPFEMSGSTVSASFFDVLRARPFLGRTFRPDDDAPAATRAFVLSHAAWIRRFGGDLNIVGRRVDISGDAEIVGVMPPEFFFPRGAEYWTPAGPDLARFARARNEPVEPSYNGLNVFFGIARLDAGTSMRLARDQSGPVVRALGEEYKFDASHMTIGMTPLADHIFGPARRGLMVLMGAVVVVLLVACVNVAGLLLARGASRVRETAVRTALGASRLALIRPLLVEASMLAIAGALLGISVAAMTLDALVALSPADIPRLDAVALDGAVLAFALGLTALTTLVLGLAPVYRLRDQSVAEGLRGTSTGVASPSGSVRSRGILVALQAGATVVLLIAAGLCVESFARLNRLDLGFDPTNVLTFSVEGLNNQRYPTKAQRDIAVGVVLERMQRTPGVVAAGAVYLRPFEHRSIGMDSWFVIEGQATTPEAFGANPMVNWESATPGYFRSMGIPLLRGRTFAETDTATSPSVVIVSEVMAARMWPGEDAIGKRLRLQGIPESAPDGGWSTVVGVVATARYRQIETARFDLYVPHQQAEEPNVRHYMVRSRIDPVALVPALREAAASVDPGLSLDGVTTMEAIVRRTRGPWHFNMLVFSMFGGVALELAAMGLSASWPMPSPNVHVRLASEWRSAPRARMSCG